MKAVVAAFNQEKALVGAFSVITNLRMELFEALVPAHCQEVVTTIFRVLCCLYKLFMDIIRTLLQRCHDDEVDARMRTKEVEF